VRTYPAEGSQNSGLLRAAIAMCAAVVVGASAAALVTAVFARSVVTPPRRPIRDVRILAADIPGGTVTFNETADTLLPGRYSLYFADNGGHARIGEILAVGPTGVTRALLAISYGDLMTARLGRISGWFFRHPRELAHDYVDVVIPGPLGQAPAWHVPPADPTSTDWIIQVHGRAAARGETLRAVDVARRSGYHSLLISYRNDGDAPESADKRFGLGDTEWEDVEAAIAFAVEQGAARIVLMGWSMGGAAVLQAATRSRFEPNITGIILESPVIDWHETLRFRASEMRLPRLIGEAVLATISAPWGTAVTGSKRPVDLRRLNFVARSSELTLPTLLLHSDDDGFVPSTSSRLLAKTRHDIVTFVPFSVARHTKLWNYDEPRWNNAISDWLAAL
jgi:alpha-beta hydrolase superfamily lysophospholipase